MNAEPTPTPRPLQTPEQAEKLRKIVEEQGKVGKSTLENLEGIGKDLWDSDEDLDRFLEEVYRRRREDA